MQKILIVLFIIGSFYRLEAQIVATKTIGCVPLNVGFTAPVGMSNYYWDFDNGGSSTDQNPSGVLFTTAKVPYKVTLRECKTCPVLHTINIEAYNKPTLSCPDKKGCYPLDVSLFPVMNLPPSITATSIKYIFGDGNSQTKTASGLTPGTNVYNAPNSQFDVSFEIVTDPPSAGCDQTITLPKLVKTSDLRINSILASPQYSCIVPTQVFFVPNITSSRPIVSYEWDFGDGGTSNIREPNHTYTQKNTYNVVLKIVDDYGCIQTANVSVVVKENDMTRIISKDTICINSFIELNIDGNSGLTTRWTLHNNASTFNRPAFDYIPTAGWKTIKVSAYYGLNECLKTATKQVYVLDPEIEYKVISRPLCNKRNIFVLECTNKHLFKNIRWELYSFDYYGNTILLKDLGTQFIQNVDFTLPNLDTIMWDYRKSFLKITAESIYGCMASSVEYNIINPLIAHVAPTVTRGCVPLKVGFYDRTTLFRQDTLVEWKLYFGDGQSKTLGSFIDTEYHTYTQRGIYDMYMIVKNQYGCVDTTYTTKIYVGDTHSADFNINIFGDNCSSNPNALVSLSSLLHDSLVDYTKFWGDGFECTESSTMAYRPYKKTGVIPIKMEVSDRGCFSQVSKNINIKGPHANFIDTQKCIHLDSVFFTNLSDSAHRYFWDFGDGSTDTSRNPRKFYSKDSIYQVMLISYNDSSGCPPDTMIRQVQIQTPRIELSKDMYLFCYNVLPQIVDVSHISGQVDNNFHSPIVWEFNKSRPPTRTFDNQLNINIQNKVKDTVIVSIRNFMNCISKDTALFIVDSISEITTIQPNPICPNDTIHFNTVAQSLTSFITKNWAFDDGYSDTNLVTKHNYEFHPNGYNFFYPMLKLNTVSGCSYTKSHTLKVKKLKLGIDTTNNVLCLQSDTIPLTLIAKNDTPYICDLIWKFPNGLIDTGYTVDYKFNTSGIFNIKVYAVDKSNNNCVDTVQIPITVHKRPRLEIKTNKSNLAALCFPLSIDLSYVDHNNSSILTRKWTIYDSIDTNIYNNNLTVSKTLEKGLNRVVLTANTKFCKDTTILDLMVRSPSGEFEIDKNDICKGDEITFTVKNLIDVTDYSIDFGDGSVVANTPVLKHKYNYVPIGGKTVAKGIFATNGNDCVGAPFDTTIRIHEVYAKFSIDYNADTAICYRAVFIKDSSLGANHYQWNFGDGSMGIMKEPGYRKFPDTGDYTVTLTIKNTTYGCVDSFIDSLRLLPLPQSKSFDDTICYGNLAKLYQLNKQDSIIYLWSPKGFHPLNITDTIEYKPDSSFQYVVTAIDTTSKCTQSDTGFVHVVQPIIPIKLDTIIPPGADIVLPFSPIMGYEHRWLIDSFLTCTNCKDPTAKYILNPIIYRVYYRDLLKNCFNDTSIYKIDVFPDIIVDAPRAFTPNGDGNNDVYYARGMGIKRLLSFKIYNRFGQLLFYSTNENIGWDGKYKDVNQNSETYFFTIEAESYIPNKIVTKEGNFLLLR